ncbi:MAG: hypothetical protein OSB21_07260 [Myxococcota bacterium]|nr:hypothetical protein [Myxococcota bacterium]
MSYHRIDAAIHEGMLTVITLTFGRSLEASEATLLADDMRQRLRKIAGRPIAILLDLRSLVEIDVAAFELINALEDHSRRYANLLDICHVTRPLPETQMGALLSEDQRPSPVFENCAEAVGFLTGSDEGFELSAA